MSLRTLLLAALALVAFVAPAVLGCGMHSYVSGHTVSLAATPPNVSATAYTLDEIIEVTDGYDAYGRPAFAKNNDTTFACVDSRGNAAKFGFPVLTGTAGGDFSEFLAALVIYHRHKKMNMTESSVKTVFHKFLQTAVTVRRPFYYHSAESNLELAMKELGMIFGKAPIVMPMVQPTNKTVADAWYRVLSADPAYQGCGHIRMIMLYPERFGLAGSEANSTTWLIKSFFKYWWPTKVNSQQRQKVYFPILTGALVGRALSIVSNAGPACPGHTPTLSPLHADSTQFIYAAAAVTDFRSQTLVPWFVNNMDSKLNATKFLADLTALQDLQLTQTLQLLSPLNRLPIYSVAMNTTDPAMAAANGGGGRKLSAVYDV